MPAPHPRRKEHREAAVMEREILRLLAQRQQGTTICPSEAARSGAEACGLGLDEWRSLMPAARDAAARLATAKLVEVTQAGQVVDVAEARGPIRIRSVAS